MNRNRIGMLALQTVLVILLATRAAQALEETQKLTASAPAAGDFFGTSVSVSGATAVVGTRGDDGGGSAYVFTRTGGAWGEEQKITASDAAGGDFFGSSVSVSGDTAVVGAYEADDSGSAYVFTRTGGVWSEQQKLTASDATAGDLFGVSVSIFGDTAVVGAYQNDDSGEDAGSAYVFTRIDGVWSEQQKLTASDAVAKDEFGTSVSVSGDTAIIGARKDDDGGSASGSAYVFTRTGGIWSQQDKLTASDPAVGDFFGISASVSGDTAIIGAWQDDDAGHASGSAYVFTRNGGVWSQQDKLTASDATAADQFGVGVSVSGDAVVVSAFGDGDGGTASGSAYVFTRRGVVWTQQIKLTASDAASEDIFGLSVAVSGDTAFVGAGGNDDVEVNSGSAYVFDLGLDKLIASDGLGSDQFGKSVAVSGDTALVGAFLNDAAGTNAGSAYVFTRSDGAWSEKQQLTASDAEAIDFFGSSVALSGDTAVVGAPFDGDGGSGSGSAYVFARSEGVWSEQQKLTADDAAEGDQFGFSVSVSGDTVLAGAYSDDDGGSNSGSAYVFTRSDGVWSQQQKLTASDDGADDQFGFSVSVSGNTALVGANSDGSGGDGSAYVFTRSDGVWSQQQKLSASDAAAGFSFGWSVSVSGDTAFVGAYLDDGGAGNAGSVYVFTRIGSVWSEEQKLNASDAAAGDEFGYSVSVSGNAAVIGAFGDDDAGPFSGSAYVFARSGGVWSEQEKLTAEDGAGGDRFGITVSLSGGTVIAGASGDDDAGLDSGSAYIFDIESTSLIHTADQDANNLVSLSELLRVIQFFNSGGLHCQDGTEDGYGPGVGDTSCSPHDSDYNAQDWEISLSELLRFIQFFNSNGYHACPDENTEDGYCPGVGPD